MSALAKRPSAGIPRINWQGVPVVTTETLAMKYEAEPKQIANNFGRNKVRFSEGKHYFRLAGADLGTLRTSLRGVQISNRTRVLYLWTERGAMQHAKILETDVAWRVFEGLVDLYFENRDRRSTMVDRVPLHHDAIDIGAQEGWPLSKVYSAFNRWIGVKQMSAMTIPQVTETQGFSGRMKARAVTANDRARIEANEAKIHGESRQMPLLGMSA